MPRVAEKPSAEFAKWEDRLSELSAAGSKLDIMFLLIII